MSGQRVLERRRDLSPADMFVAVEIAPTGTVRWLESVPSQRPGVYVVSLHADPNDGSGLVSAPLDSDVLGRWLDQCPGLTVDSIKVGVDALRSHIAQWWLPSTSILYVGKAQDQSLHDRVDQYYSTALGKRSPHGGGYWLKTLGVLGHVTIHYAETAGDRSPGDFEDDLLNAFPLLIGNPPQIHPEPALPLPWVNLQVDRPPPRRRRDHRLPSLRDQMRPRG